MKNFMVITLFIISLNNVYADIKPESLVSCVLKPNKEVKVSSSVIGVLSEVNVKKGSYVKKGQVIARLDYRQELARLKTAKTKADYAKRKLIRYDKMINNNMISQNEIDEIKTELNVANSEVNEINTMIKSKTIHSPITGYIIKGDISKGEYVGSDPIVTIADVSTLYADMIIRATAFGSIKINDVINLEIISPTKQKRKAKIKQIDKLIDAASGTFNVRAYFLNNAKIPAGINCSFSGL